MGDLQAWMPQPNGFLGDENPPPFPSLSSNPHPSAIKPDSWRQAEQGTREIIRQIQPTRVSEERRKTVIDYVQRLIGGFIGSEVLPFGSVPLKTYLPDGDIDLTALCDPNAEDALAIEVHSILEAEEQNIDAEFEVKDVQYIHAEVKLVKCLVQNIIVDISFNQIGGLCTLCFLEQVDRLIGKDHLFKRSIILIKAWCYYESRILGAHHSLISTYALETLVLYIFHMFHSYLDGPLAVLYRFLDYFSKFDWDNYCISLHGPISVSSFPELVAEPPETDGSNLLLSKEFLQDCVDMFSATPKGLDNNSRIFPLKHLNIVDPLKENNNLGRSVSKGNFYRIRSAFAYGARKLGRVLLLPGESIAGELNALFLNTLDRHGSGQRPDVQDAIPCCPDSVVFDRTGVASVSPDSEVGKNGEEDKLMWGSPTLDSHGVLCEELNNIKISGLEKEHGAKLQLGRHSSYHHPDANGPPKCAKMGADDPMEANVVSGCRLTGDARDLASIRPSSSRSVSAERKASSSNSEAGAPFEKAYHTPHFFLSPEGSSVNGVHDRRKPTNSGTTSKVSFTKPLGHNEETSLVLRSALNEADSSRSSTSSRDVHLSENSCLTDCLVARYEDNGYRGSPKSANLSDLRGDYDMHLSNLQYAQRCQSYISGGFIIPMHPPSSQFHNKHSWDAIPRRNGFSHINASRVVPGLPFSPSGCYPVSTSLISGAYGAEDMQKPRGTGTYFPITNHRSYRERQSLGRGRNLVPASQQPRPRSNGRAMTPPDTNLADKGSHELPLQVQFPVLSGNSGRGKPGLLDIPQASNPALKGFSHANGFALQPEGRLAFGSFRPVPLGAPALELGKSLDSFSPQSQSSGPHTPASTVQRPEESLNRERAAQTYQLKDEGDFPPLHTKIKSV